MMADCSQNLRAGGRRRLIMTILSAQIPSTKEYPLSYSLRFVTSTES